MKIEKHLDWDLPEIWISEDDFDLEIKRDVIKIDYYNGRNGAGIYIPIKVLQDLLDEYKAKTGI